MTYEELLQHIVTNGENVYNERTEVNCRTILNATLQYKSYIPTQRFINWKGAIAEIEGYLQGCTYAQEFEALGTKTWSMNANNPKWLSNPHHNGEKGYLGPIYGAQDKGQLANVRERLKRHEDDRRLIINWWNPEDLDKGCLAPCMYQHHFSILGGKLYLTSYQRSADVPLGLPYNMVQCTYLLHKFAHEAGLGVGYVTHHIVNAHIYENQLEKVIELLDRDVYPQPYYKHGEGFIDYQHGESIKIPFTA